MTVKRALACTTLLATLFIAEDGAAAPCAGFTDVDDASPFCGGVAWMANRQVTTGCGTGLYCPGDSVSRLAMAAFMSRLGAALTPRRVFVDQNPGPVNLQGGGANLVCGSPSVPSSVEAAFAHKAVIHGTAWGLVDAPVNWMADIWYTTNAGLTWSYIVNFIPGMGATPGALTQVTTFAQMELDPAKAYVFAIRVRESPDGVDGTGNFTDLACHLLVEIGNSNAVPTPPPPPPCDPQPGRLHPNIPGCN